MHDVEHNDPLRRWLADDLFVLNAVFLVAASSLAIALTSCLWHHIHPEPPSQDQQHQGNAPSVLSAALASLRIAAPRTVPQTIHYQPPSSPSSPATEQMDHKSTRSKERRRRGKDPFKDLLKGSKKSKALVKALKAADHDHPPLSTDTLSNSSAPGNDTASSTSRSPSPEPATAPMDLDMDGLAPRLPAESDDGGARHDSTSSTSPDNGPDTTDGIRPRSVPPDCMTTTDTQVNISSASTVTPHASEDIPSFPSVSADVCTPPPRNSQAASTSGSCAKFVRARTRLRVSRIEAGVTSSLLSSALPDSVASPLSCPSLSSTPSTNSADGFGPSTPTNSRGSTPPPRSLFPSENPSQGEQPLDQTASAQLASMHDVLEAARLREEQLRVEAEQASNERDELRWRWNKDAGAWRRREAELQAHIHHLMQQLQAYAAVASFHVQQASSGFSSPTSPHAHSPHLQHHALVPFPLPPPIQAQNSASAPAHVQALLASAPMLPSHPGYAAPSGGLYPGAAVGTSPLLWSGLGLCVPKWDPRHGGRRTPDSSASGSSSRGRRRRRRAENLKSASDESSLGDWDGMEDASGDEDPWEEEEEDVFENNALADAILKRPESIRGLSGSVGKRSGTGRVNGGRPVVHGTGEVERMGMVKDPAMDKHVSPLVDTAAVRTVSDTSDQQ